MYEDIEKVKENGMTMWKWGNQLFLTKDDAKREVKKSRVNRKALVYGYVEEPDYDPIAIIMSGDVLRGIKF